MRIVVNDIAASTGGAMTVLRDFYSCVCNHDSENQWLFLLNDRYFEETENVKIITLPEVKKSRMKKLQFDFITGKRFIQALEPDVVLSLQNIITFGLKVPQVVYVHQSIPFQEVRRFSFFKAEERSLAVIQYLIGAIIKLSARHSNTVIVQTQWMKTAICKKCRLPEDRVITSLPVVRQEQLSQIETTFDKTAFFYPTADEIYKNNDCIRQASKMLAAKGVEHIVTLTLPPEESEETIRCVGRLPHDAVIAQYQKSTLVFPSYVETFGYPLAEARMVGTVVLAANTLFAREVLNGYENAYFFDPFNPEELAILMERVVSDEIIKRNSKEPAQNTEDSWLMILKFIQNM